jgi:nucleoside-diphosphate-sugar epimerase
MTILGTGVVAFIGFHLARRLLPQEQRVVGLDNERLLRCFAEAGELSELLHGEAGELSELLHGFRFVRLDNLAAASRRPLFFRQPARLTVAATSTDS